MYYNYSGRKNNIKKCPNRRFFGNLSTKGRRMSEVEGNGVL